MPPNALGHHGRTQAGISGVGVKTQEIAQTVALTDFSYLCVGCKGAVDMTGPANLSVEQGLGLCNDAFTLRLGHDPGRLLPTLRLVNGIPGTARRPHRADGLPVLIHRRVVGIR